MVKLIEIVQSNRSDFSLREVYVNPNHVVYLREDVILKHGLTQHHLSFQTNPSDLYSRQ